MSKLTLSNLANLQNEATAVSTINGNNATLTTAFDNTLSRDGTVPNTMGANLDMNSNQILNLPAPVSGSSPARLVDVVSNPTLILTIPAVGTSGAVVGLLNTNNTHSGNNTFSGSNTISGATSITGIATFASNKLVGTNAILNSTTVTGSGSGTVTLPAATDTLVGKATTDTLTNKTLDTAGTGNVLKINGTTVNATTGSGSVVLATTPTLVTPVLGAATGTSLTTTGKISSTSPTTGIGYSTGAGGTVTQLTNKSTGVTLNTICGQITMNNASLASGITGVTFVLTNSTIGLTDVVVVSIAATGMSTGGSYSTAVDKQAAGSCAITIRNLSGGTLSEALTVNFIVIKGVIS